MTTETTAADALSYLTVNGRHIPVVPIGDFMGADKRRPTSFVTNFGNWQLPPAAAAAMNSPVAHLEWFHDTGELVAFGQVPKLGAGANDITARQAAIDTLAAPLGGAAGRVVHSADGSVREYFPAMVVGPDTRVALLAIVEHGPRVHEHLWGWHLKHRDAEGWAWLETKLRLFSKAEPSTQPG